jgi:hypothetical protein
MMLYTTLNKIRNKWPGEAGLAKLLRYLGKTQADDERLSFKTILKSNGLDDAIWCLRSVEGYDREIRLFVVSCARRVEHLDKTGQAKRTNDVSERFANGLATTEELNDARAAAAWDERDAASDAAWVAARAARWAAALDAPDAASRYDVERAKAAQKQDFIKFFCREEVYKFYTKVNSQPMRPYIPGEDLTGISVNKEDTPEEGGMIAFNLLNPEDKWYIAKDFFNLNYREVKND